MCFDPQRGRRALGGAIRRPFLLGWGSPADDLAVEGQAVVFVEPFDEFFGGLEAVEFGEIVEVGLGEGLGDQGRGGGEASCLEEFVLRGHVGAAGPDSDKECLSGSDWPFSCGADGLAF